MSFPNFPRQRLETMRQPLEDGSVTIVRAGGRVTFPIAMHAGSCHEPMPMWASSGTRNGGARIAMAAIHRYRSKISGPLLRPHRPSHRSAGAKTQDLDQAKPANPALVIRERGAKMLVHA